MPHHKALPTRWQEVLPYHTYNRKDQAMHEKETLGKALSDAMERKGVGPTEVAHHFGVKPPSVTDWKTTGRIAKKHIEKLVEYFSDVVGPEHWGLTAQSAQWFGWPENTRTLNDTETPRITPPTPYEALSTLQTALSYMSLPERERIAQLLYTFALSPGQALKTDIASQIKQFSQKKRAA